MKFSAKATAPIVVIIVAVALYVGAIWARTTPEPIEVVKTTPMVQVLTVKSGPVQLHVRAQGTVEPRTESELVSEISGRIVWVSPDLASGGFFGRGEALIRIDRRDFDVALEGARASLARAESDLVHAKSRLARQNQMRQNGASSRSMLDDAIHQRASAEAGVREAKVAVRRAELDLERTEISAPYAGRVREKYVDVGQFVSRGVKLARVYSVDYAEVLLPISVAELAFLDLPLGFREVSSETDDSASLEAALEFHGPKVTLSASYAGERHKWIGTVVRTEGALDPRTRMLNIVVRVDDPYNIRGRLNRPPLAIGLFVDAEITGRVVEGVFEVPRSALRLRGEVLVVDKEDRLRVRRVKVLRSQGDRSWIRSGIKAGERVITSPLNTVIEGMKVRTTEHVSQAAAAAAFYNPSARRS